MKEIENILTSILNCSRTDLYLNDIALSDKQVFRLNSILKKRIQGDPLQYLMGYTEFMGLRFKVNKHVLIPRPETEILVEAALGILAKKKCASCDILDIGTGCGNITISLAKSLTQSKIIGIDISPAALKVAKENARLNQVGQHVDFLRSDLFSGLSQKNILGSGNLRFDMIISNPPYIPSGEIAKLAKEVRCEPRMALDGGRDGLRVYRRIIKESPACLKKHGILIMEIGYNQSKVIKNILDESGCFELTDIIKDYSKINRIVVAELK